MKRRLLDYDPLTKESVFFEMDDTGIAYLTHHQDDQHIIDYNARLQKDDEYSKRGMKEDWWHYARVPNTLIYKWMFEDGINFFKKEDTKKVFEKLNSPEYSKLKVTTKRHG